MQRKIFTSLIAAALFAAIPLGAVAQIAPGTILTGTIDQDLSSNHVQAGTPFTISNAHTPNSEIDGATIYGHVASVQAAGQGTSGKITLAYDKVSAPDGTYLINGYTQNVDLQTKSNAAKTVGGAAAGALVGGLLGHGVGALLGAGAGAAIAGNNRQNVLIPAGSAISVQVVRARRQA
jgi:hypothetical protein